MSGRHYGKAVSPSRKCHEFDEIAVHALCHGYGQQFPARPPSRRSVGVFSSRRRSCWPAGCRRRTGQRCPLQALVARGGRPAAGTSSSTSSWRLNDTQRSRGLMFREKPRALRRHAVRFPPGSAGQLLDEEHADPARHDLHRRRRHDPARSIPTPCRMSTDTIPSQFPVRGVLEINGGSAKLLGIKPGDKVMHPIFGNA